MAINKVILLGNVGRPPEIRQGKDGSPFATFSLATTDKGYTRRDGTQVPERTEWHNIVANGSIVQVIERYVTQGMKLYIEGKLRTRKYVDRNNIERTTTEVMLDQMELCGGKSETQSAPQQQGGYQQTYGQQQYGQQYQQAQYQQPQYQQPLPQQAEEDPPF